VPEIGIDNAIFIGIQQWPVVCENIENMYKLQVASFTRGSHLPGAIETGMKNREKNMCLYSVRGLERSELGGSHGCPGRLWDRCL